MGGEDSSREILLTLDPVKQELQKTELMDEYHLTVGICSDIVDAVLIFYFLMDM